MDKVVGQDWPMEASTDKSGEAVRCWKNDFRPGQRLAVWGAIAKGRCKSQHPAGMEHNMTPFQQVEHMLLLQVATSPRKEWHTSSWTPETYASPLSTTGFHMQLRRNGLRLAAEIWGLLTVDHNFPYRNCHVRSFGASPVFPQTWTLYIPFLPGRYIV